MNGIRTGALALVLALSLPVVANAVPTISSIFPAKTSSNTGDEIIVYCDDCGYSTDRVYFPGTSNWVNPRAWSLDNYVIVRVPMTWSGNVQLQKQGAGTLSNAVAHEISFSYRGAKWPAASITWRLNTAAAPGLTFDAVLGALSSSYDAWECASGFTATYGGSTTTASSTNDGANVRYWSGSLDPGVIALSTTWADGSDIVEQDIAFSTAYTWGTTGGATVMDVQSIATHEHGHGIGFKDLYGTPDDTKTMYGYGDEGETFARTLQTDDALGVEWCYSHTRVNFTQYTPAGWYAPIVPRNTNDATGASAPLPATLNGNATTYWNAAVTNSGGDCAAPSGRNEFYLDSELKSYPSWSGVWSPGVNLEWMNIPITVRGGRHTMEHRFDTLEEALESNEYDNAVASQYVWEPYVLADQVEVTRAAPPPVGSLVERNCDGFEFTGHWWGAVGILAVNAADDYDLGLYADATSSTTGFADEVAFSGYGGTFSDFVVVNGNAVGSYPVRWAGVVRYSGGAGNVLVQQSNELLTVNPDTTYGTSYLTSLVTIGGNEVLKVFEFYLRSSRITYTFSLENDTGTADLDMGLYGAGDYFSKNEYLRVSQVSGSPNETFTYKPAEPGFYALVVWKRSQSSVGLANTFRVRVGPSLSNLDATLATSGFAHPLTPRNHGDAVWGSPVVVSDTLEGNLARTWLNFQVTQEGPNATPRWYDRIFLDDVEVFWGGSPDPDAPGVSWWTNSGPITVRGGRHTLTHFADHDSTLAESDETDNTWGQQWVWSPLTATRATPLVRNVPPVWGDGAHPNADGLHVARPLNLAWVASILPTNALDDYDLYVYRDYAGPTAGYSDLMAASTYVARYVDFVVGQYQVPEPAVYPAVVRYNAGGGGAYVMDWIDSQGRFAAGSPDRAYKDQVLAANRLADVYEVSLSAGATVHAALMRTSGTANLRFSIFPSTSGGMWNPSGAAQPSTAVSTSLDTLAYTATATGWHPIVVYRDVGTDLGSVTYQLEWNQAGVVDVPDEPPVRTLEFAGPWPNPVVADAQFAFALPEAGPVSMQLFDTGGRRVRTLAEGVYSAGRHRVTLNGMDRDVLPAGIYWIRFSAAGRTFTKLVTLLH